METNILDENNSSINQIGLGKTDKYYLFTAAKWSQFLGIVGFVMTGIIAIVVVFLNTVMKNVFAPMARMQGGDPKIGSGIGMFITIFYLGIAILTFFYARYIYNFGTKTKAAILSNDPKLLTEGFKNLKSMFRFAGILTAIALCFYVLLIGFGLIGALLAGSRLHP